VFSAYFLAFQSARLSLNTAFRVQQQSISHQKLKSSQPVGNVMKPCPKTGNAIISKNSVPAAIRQQRQLLWQNQGQRQVDSG
jgi:hypothetical protein